MFVNWVRTYELTPGAGANGSDFTELWRDDFDADSGRFWRANGTFDAAINDYVPENAALRNGYLVLALTSDAGKGDFPVPPADDGLTPTPTTTTTCRSSLVTYDAEAMQKPAGGTATGGWNLWTYGSAQISHDFRGGDSIVTVKAWGQSASGVWPHMVVRVDDQVIGETNVQATATVRTSTSTPYQAEHAQRASLSTMTSTKTERTEIFISSRSRLKNACNLLG